jgi:hypothetical protein
MEGERFSNPRTSDELREQAARCFRSAARLRRGTNSETRKRFGREFLEMAERLEAIENEVTTPRRPGRA